jgi:O-antigen/teichoic acid export membrane protein
MLRRTDPARATGATIVKGAAVLGIAAVLSKVLGVLQKIPLQNLAGDGAFGIYSAVYPFYVLLLFLATAGFPAAISALVAESTAAGDRLRARRILFWSSVMTTGTGCFCFALMFAGADRIALWIGHPGTAEAIRSVSFALLFVPVMAAMRGYFQGLQDMVPTAVSQVAEQSIRVGTMAALLLYGMAAGFSDERIAAGAMFGSVTGGAAGLLVMGYYWRRHVAADRKPGRSTEPPIGRERTGPLVRRILTIAVPVCIGSVAVPIFGMIDTFTIPRALLAAGGDEAEIMARFGVYSRGLPLVQLAAMVAGAVAAALIPALTESRRRNDIAAVRARSEMAVRLAWLFGLAASVGLAMLAGPVNVMLYEDRSGTVALAVISFTAVFSALYQVTAALLQGLGKFAAPALHMLLAAALKTALNLALIPRWGINGAAAAAVAAYAAAAMLNTAAVLKHAGIRPDRRTYLLTPAVSLAVMAAGVFAARQAVPAAVSLAWPGVPERAVQTCTSLSGIITGALLYTAALARRRAVREQEWLALPGTGSRLIRLLKRLRLM